MLISFCFCSCNYYRPSSCGKVMFSVMSVCSMGRVGVLNRAPALPPPSPPYRALALALVPPDIFKLVQLKPHSTRNPYPQTCSNLFNLDLTPQGTLTPRHVQTLLTSELAVDYNKSGSRVIEHYFVGSTSIINM